MKTKNFLKDRVDEVLRKMIISGPCFLVSAIEGGMSLDLTRAVDMLLKWH